MNKFKPVRVFFNGERLKDVYPHASTWEVLKYRTAKGLRTCAILSLVGLVVFTGFKVGQHNPDVSFRREVSNVIVPTAFAGVTLEEKVNELKQKLADDMVKCENPTHVLVNPDDNKAGTLPLKDKVSIGDLQMKISTVQNFFHQLHGTNLTDREALMLALDTEKARQLAIDSWLNIKGSINQWSCSTDEMRQMVSDIRFLTK